MLLTYSQMECMIYKLDSRYDDCLRSFAVYALVAILASRKDDAEQMVQIPRPSLRGR